MADDPTTTAPNGDQDRITATAADCSSCDHAPHEGQCSSCGCRPGIAWRCWKGKCGEAYENGGYGVTCTHQQTATVDPTTMTLLAWVGPDEFDSTRGIKSAMSPVGWVPLAFKGEHEDRARNNQLRAQLQNLANQYGTRIQLVRFHYAEIIETVHSATLQSTGR